MKKKSKKPAQKKASKKTPAASGVGITPMADRVVVRPLRPEEMGHKLPSGIIIPETVDKEKPEQGIVVAVGPGRRGDDNDIIPVAVRAGDRVLFSKYGYDEVKIKGTEYVIVSENNILAVLD